jgi:hypothetical protein
MMVSKIKSIGIMILIIALLTLFYGCKTQENKIITEKEIEFETNTEEKEIEKRVLGYCPTMQEIAQEIQAKNEFISIKALGSTAEAFMNLNSKNVDMVLVGRVANKNELGEVSEKRIREGLTLVGKNKRFLSIQELEESRVHTAIDEKQVLEYLSEKVEVVYYSSTQEAIEKGIGEIVLIDWKDYDEKVSLVIPVNEYMQKIEKFRLPVLYTYDEDLLEIIHI